METHEKIRLIRELNRWSQEEVAEKLEMSAGGYAKIERGETKLNIDRLQKLAEIFSVEVWDLLQNNQNGLVLQINEGNHNHGYSFTSANSTEVEILELELKHCREMLQQKELEIELLRKIVDMTK